MTAAFVELFTQSWTGKGHPAEEGRRMISRTFALAVSQRKSARAIGDANSVQGNISEPTTLELMFTELV